MLFAGIATCLYREQTAELEQDPYYIYGGVVSIRHGQGFARSWNAKNATAPQSCENTNVIQRAKECGEAVCVSI